MLFQKVSSTTKSKHTHKYVVWLLILFRSLLTTYFLIDIEKYEQIGYAFWIINVLLG